MENSILFFPFIALQKQIKYYVIWRRIIKFLYFLFYWYFISPTIPMSHCMICTQNFKNHITVLNPMNLYSHKKNFANCALKHIDCSRITNRYPNSKGTAYSLILYKKLYFPNISTMTTLKVDWLFGISHVMKPISCRHQYIH